MIAGERRPTEGMASDRGNSARAAEGERDRRSGTPPSLPLKHNQPATQLTATAEPRRHPAAAREHGASEFRQTFAFQGRLP
jgi:hypothetical protein